MILLVAPPSSIRAVLISFFEREDLSAKICDSFAAALSAYAKIPQFELVLTDYRIEGDRVEAFMADLAEHERPMPILVFNAPLKAEAELFRRGAIAVLPPGYSPQSLALQCVNLVSLVEQKTASPAVRRQAVADFELGGAMVSPERRSLSRRRRGKGKSGTVGLTQLQVRLLQTLQASPGAVLDYDFLFHLVWHRPYQGNSAALREAVSSLRRRFRRLGLNLDNCVMSAYGQGFRYDPL